MSLPDGLKFLQVGWWAVHLLAFGLVYSYGFRAGRAAERREARGQRAAKSTS